MGDGYSEMGEEVVYLEYTLLLKQVLEYAVWELECTVWCAGKELECGVVSEGGVER